MKTITKNNGDMILCSNEHELELDENSLLDNEKESFLTSKTNNKNKKQRTEKNIEIFIEFGLIDDNKSFSKIENMKGIFHSLSKNIEDTKKILILEFTTNENKSIDCVNKLHKIYEEQSLNAVKYYIKIDTKYTDKVVIGKLKEFQIKNVFNGNLSFKIVLSE